MTNSWTDCWTWPTDRFVYEFYWSEHGDMTQVSVHRELHKRAEAHPDDETEWSSWSFDLPTAALAALYDSLEAIFAAAPPPECGSLRKLPIEALPALYDSLQYRI